MSQNVVRPAPEPDVAISSRIRLARNLENCPFTPRMTREQSGMVLSKVKEAIFSRSEEAQKFVFIDMNNSAPVDRQELVEKHLISPEFSEGDRSRAAIVSKDGITSIMVNEEDHLRLQCIFPGMQLEEAWKLCDSLDTMLGEQLDFAFDKGFGYLTCCPTNVGTGMRASVMLHLPALSMTGYIKNILEACSKLGVAVRGIYGENSEATGNMFQISNQVSLGQREEEIIAGITNIASQIIGQERTLRSELYKQNPVRFEDKIFRSLGILSNARLISTEESIKLLSDVRLGVITGLISGMELDELNKMIMMVQPAYMQKLSGGQLSPDERDQKRAEFIRKKLKGRME